MNCIIFTSEAARRWVVGSRLTVQPLTQFSIAGVEFIFRNFNQSHFLDDIKHKTDELFVYLLLFYLFFFLFYEIECKKGRTRMIQPLCTSKDPCITEEKGKLIK